MINDPLLENVRQWGFDRGILGPHLNMNEEELRLVRLAQAKKTLEEVHELVEAIGNDDRVEARDAIGDIMVTLIMQAELWDTGIGSCLYDAYCEIKDRKGTMVDGQFVKESDS